MTYEKKNSEKELEHAIIAIRNDELGPQELEAAGDRVWTRLQAAAENMPAIEQIRSCEDVRALLPAYEVGKLNVARALLVQDHLRECVSCHNLARAKVVPDAEWVPVEEPTARWSMRQWATAAAAVVVVGALALFLNGWYFATPAGARAKVQSTEGAVYVITATGERVLAPGDELGEGDIVRTAGGGHAFLRLRDASLVEMNERAEFSVTARRNDTTVHLDQGSVIVQAAKRRSGHLYVITPDCRVAVTGTVFSVNSGAKGSRVAVIEGVVRVAEAGKEHELRAGDQVATGAALEPVPLDDEFAWSSNRGEYLKLLTEFAALQKKFDQIPTPGLRFSSVILQRMPANTVVYAAMPNLGDALVEAHRIFQDQLQQSAELRKWWYGGHRGGDGPTADQIVEKIHLLSQYLGDEIVLASFSGHTSGEANAVVLAEVRRPGLPEFLQKELMDFGAANHAQNAIRVIRPNQLASMSPVRLKGAPEQMLALVRGDFVAFSPSVSALQTVNAQLNSGGGTFTGTEFGQRVQGMYQEGADFVLALNLQQMIAESQLKASPMQTPAQRRHNQLTLARSGFGDAKYLFVSHRDLNGTPDSRAVVEFAGERHGVPSWLAAPSGMGSLEFVSANAGAVISGVAKAPALMLDDMLRLSGSANPEGELAKAESELNVNIRNDLMGSFGGEATLALDGPVLPTPSWKFIAEVNDRTRVQNAIQQLVATANRMAAEHGLPSAQLQEEDAYGRKFQVVRLPGIVPLAGELHYTFAGNYLIVAPSRALLMNALQIKEQGNSLLRSAEFRSLLPKDQHTGFSAVLYQNLAPVLQPITSQLNSEQLGALQQLLADSKPTVICAYGEQNRIEVASASKLLSFNANLMALPALLGKEHRGTLQLHNP